MLKRILLGTAAAALLLAGCNPSNENATELVPTPEMVCQAGGAGVARETVCPLDQFDNLKFCAISRISSSCAGQGDTGGITAQSCRVESDNDRGTWKIVTAAVSGPQPCKVVRIDCAARCLQEVPTGETAKRAQPAAPAASPANAPADAPPAN